MDLQSQNHQMDHLEKDHPHMGHQHQEFHMDLVRQVDMLSLIHI